MKSIKIVTTLALIAVISTNLTVLGIRCYDNNGNPTRCGLMKRLGNAASLGYISREEEQKRAENEICEHGNKKSECLKCKCEHGKIRGKCRTCKANAKKNEPTKKNRCCKCSK